MAKYKRVELGSISKEKDGTRFKFKAYIKDKDGNPSQYILKDGQYLDLESKADQLADIKFLVENGKIDTDTAKYLTDKANKMPEYVKFKVVAKEKN